MKLVHHTKAPHINMAAKLRLWFGASTSQEVTMKPSGLWVSCDDDPDNWRAWCEANEFGLERLAHTHEVVLKKDANILYLQTAGEIERFTFAFNVEISPSLPSLGYQINWPEVAKLYQGIIIAPYQWGIRLDYLWYYGWDCASGCIWDMDAIESITLNKQEEAA